MKTFAITSLVLILAVMSCCAGGGSSGGRHLFHESGHKGPHSYRFGFDTGPGPNRQFRYEERDSHGYVKGQYGYYDKNGKPHITYYEADPKNGFAAEGGFGKFPN